MKAFLIEIGMMVTAACVFTAGVIADEFGWIVINHPDMFVTLLMIWLVVPASIMVIRVNFK